MRRRVHQCPFVKHQTLLSQMAQHRIEQRRGVTGLTPTMAKLHERRLNQVADRSAPNPQIDGSSADHAAPPPASNHLTPEPLGDHQALEQHDHRKRRAPALALIDNAHLDHRFGQLLPREVPLTLGEKRIRPRPAQIGGGGKRSVVHRSSVDSKQPSNHNWPVKMGFQRA